MFKQSALQAFRFFNGAPILAPTDWQWESGVTFNAAATYLPPSEANQRLTSVLLAGTVNEDDRLRDGMVVTQWHGDVGAKRLAQGLDQRRIGQRAVDVGG